MILIEELHEHEAALLAELLEAINELDNLDEEEA